MKKRTGFFYQKYGKGDWLALMQFWEEFWVE